MDEQQLNVIQEWRKHCRVLFTLIDECGSECPASLVEDLTLTMDRIEDYLPLPNEEARP